MNKTVNINLANTFFHIDEEAYNKLRLYLEAIKRSFSGTTGSDEIIADIEARIAELFTEKMEHDRQVITQKEVDAVISVMGQPEDYMVDEDIFEDQPRNKSKSSNSKTKKLYRNTEEKYIGGVCSGLEYYLGFDALWIRLLFILLAVFTGFGLVVYILLWILVPEAVTTSQKLDMTGKPINISNIERKVKEGFDDVADKVKNVDYEKVGNKVKSGSKTFFDTLGDIFMFFFRVFGKFIGVLLIIIGAATLIGLFVGLISASVIDIVKFPGVDFYEIVNTTGVPVWLISMLILFAVGIPFFFLLYLGLKILVNNLGSIGKIAKLSLWGLWILSVGGLISLGVKQAAAFAFTGTSTVKETFVPIENDTLLISMGSSATEDFDSRFNYKNMEMVYDDDGKALFFSDDVRFDIKKSTDSLIHLKIKKDADGRNMEEARERSTKIMYDYEFSDNELILDNFLTMDTSEQIRNQRIRNIIYIPEGSLLKLDVSAKRNIGRITENDQDYYRGDMVSHIWKMGADGELKCQSCTNELEMNYEGNNEAKVIINEEGINIRSENGENRVIIDKNGIDIDVKDNKDSVRIKINEDGVNIEGTNN